MANTWLVVGLGNPGPTYASTRHNVGWMVVDEIAERARETFKGPKGVRAEIVETRLAPGGWGAPGIDVPRVVLMKSRSFMNETGGPASQVLKHVGGSVDQLVVVHDELDLELTKIRTKRGGGDNGHNGLKSIRASLGTGEFYRVRVGIGRPPGRQSPADYVLSSFAKAENADLAWTVDRAVDVVESLIRDGLEVTQNTFNS